MDRRTFLKGTGAITVAAAGGGVWRAVDQGIVIRGRGPAYEPWENWRGPADDDGPLALVRAAILASNPHNTQPWIFRVEEARIDLHADLSRGLGAFDPFLREMHIGLGCALENMVLAARAKGYEPTVTLCEGRLSGEAHEETRRAGSISDGQSRIGPPPLDDRTRVARVELSSARPRIDPLYEAIGHRHTNRAPYEPDLPVPGDLLTELGRIADTEENVDLLVFTGREKTELGRLIVEATEAIIADETMVADSDRWFRHTRGEVQEFRDGPTLDAAGLPPLTTALAKLLPRPSPARNHAYWLEATREVQVPTAPLLGILAVPELYDRPACLQAGRIWQRMHLAATTRGVAMQPLNQPVELVDRQHQLGEAPRMAEGLEKLTGGPRWKPTFVFRAGFPVSQAASSPRRPVNDVVERP